MKCLSVNEGMSGLCGAKLHGPVKLFKQQRSLNSNASSSF